MNYPYFKNIKGQFLVPIWGIIPLSEGQLASEDRDVIGKLPEKELGYFWNKKKGYGVFDLSSASNSLPVDRLTMTEEEVNNFLGNDELIKTIKKYDKNSYKKIVRIKNGLKNKTITRHEFDPLYDFAERECVALFCTMKDGREGYIQKNNTLGVLSKALLFESEKDAQATINRQAGLGYAADSFQIVNISAAVKSLGAKINSNKQNAAPTDFNKTSIFAVGALAQKKTIQDALKMASVEQLASAYKELTGEEWGVKPSEPPKRKM